MKGCLDITKYGKWGLALSCIFHKCPSAANLGKQAADIIFAASMSNKQTVAFHTLGCKLNFSETSSLSRLLEAEAFEKRDARPSPRYALEGTSSNGQQLRIIVAPEGAKMVVITVIDLGREWACHCP